MSISSNFFNHQVGKNQQKGEKMRKGQKGQAGKENPNYQHGLAGERIYQNYFHMIDRCHNPKDHDYIRYGARGINVCDEWRKDKMAFFNWAFANGYKKGLTLDRIDNNGDYSPQNCRWVTIKQQQSNKRTNHLVEINGETHTISEWAEISGILKSTIRERIIHGWSKERLLEKPRKYHSHS